MGHPTSSCESILSVPNEDSRLDGERHDELPAPEFSQVQLVEIVKFTVMLVSDSTG